MGCARGCCEYGYDKCCIECDELPTCGMACSDMDGYEYTEDCPDYRKENEDEEYIS